MTIFYVKMITIYLYVSSNSMAVQVLPMTAVMLLVQCVNAPVQFFCYSLNNIATSLCLCLCQCHIYSLSYSVITVIIPCHFIHFYSNPTQPPLASGAAKDLFQDCGPRMEMHPWHRTSISARSLRAGGESSRTFSTAVGINWMCRPAKSTDVGGPVQLRLPRAHSVEQSALFWYQ